MPKITHRYSKTPTYKTWTAMRSRCHLVTDPSYERYGGRGVRVCDKWRKSFEAFLADMGERPSLSHTIDRIDNSGNYEPENCRWATKVEQGRNRSTARILEFQGRAMSVADWADALGIPHGSIRNRLNAGWSVEETLSFPVPLKTRKRLYVARSARNDR